MRKICAMLALIFLISGCQNVPVSEETDRLLVYTSFYAMYDFARTIAGEYAHVENLVPVGVEVHDWEPSPADMIKLEEADVFIYSGKGMESWCDGVLSSLSNENLLAVETAAHIAVHEEDGHTDPHVWLDPANAILQLEAIADALSQKDPANEAHYRENLAVQTEKLLALDTAYRTELGALPNKAIVVSHKAYGYLCNAYGLEQIAAEGLSADSDASPAQLARIIETMQQNNIRHIFFAELTRSKALETIQAETGAQALVLNPFEGDSQGHSYLAVMEENLASLKTALQ